VLKSLAFIAIASYLGLAAVLWLLQEKILFHPVPVFARTFPPAGWTLEEVRITAKDGTTLVGVLLKPPGDPAPLVIYYGGNAEEITAWAPVADQYGQRAMLLVNYRGYGHSAGSPSEKALVGDALEIYDWASKRPDIDASRIALHGRSLGSGIAVQVAAQRAVRALLLTSPYDSALEVARGIYPYLPIAWMLRHPFDSAAHAPRLKIPALVIYGTTDTIIPPRHSLRLADLWGGPTERVALSGQGHNDIDSDPKYYPALSGFLDRHL
jgi:pimeloyl-ACP methyl ester carboxylesterase